VIANGTKKRQESENITVSLISIPSKGERWLSRVLAAWKAWFIRHNVGVGIRARHN
jgi:hypothetical protein